MAQSPKKTHQDEIVACFTEIIDLINFVVIDDVKLQRKSMGLMLSNMGIMATKMSFYGETNASIINFTNDMISKIKNSSNQYYILILDQNLDVDDSMKYRTLLGTNFVEEIKEGIKEYACLENKVLYIIRSANDNIPDLNLYINRADGYMSKSFFSPMELLECLSKWWFKKHIM